MFLFMVKEENICSSFPTVKYRNIWCSRSYHEDHEVLPWMVSWSLICRSSSNYELAFPWLRFQEVIGLRPCSLFLAWWSKSILYAKVDTENKRLLYACRIFSCDHQVYTRNCPLHSAKKKTFCLAIASEFVVNHSAFSFWTCDDPAHTYLKLCTLWDDQQQLRVMEVQNMVDGGPGHHRQVHGGSLQAFKDITSARLPRTKSYVHGEASWSASVLSSSVGSDFRP